MSPGFKTVKLHEEEDKASQRDALYQIEVSFIVVK